MDKQYHRVVFIDVGHSKTSIAVVDFGPSQAIIRQVQTDPNLGARDFDHQILAKV